MFRKQGGLRNNYRSIAFTTGFKLSATVNRLDSGAIPGFTAGCQ
ncbi:MAG TPA: hypothetical protein VJZ27_20410 [Aggregatilineales bacterium]|nr:hypothetical protein [Aggregatilineales bacterium]